MLQMDLVNHFSFASRDCRQILYKERASSWVWYDFSISLSCCAHLTWELPVELMPRKFQRHPQGQLSSKFQECLSQFPSMYSSIFSRCLPGGFLVYWWPSQIPSEFNSILQSSFPLSFSNTPVDGFLPASLNLAVPQQKTSLPVPPHSSLPANLNPPTVDQL